MRKRRVVGTFYGMKYGWKRHKDRNRHKNRIKRSGQARWVYARHKSQRPHHVKVSQQEQTKVYNKTSTEQENDKTEIMTLKIRLKTCERVAVIL